MCSRAIIDSLLANMILVIHRQTKQYPPDCKVAKYMQRLDSNDDDVMIFYKLQVMAG